MTAAIVSPVDPLLLRYGLKLRDLPVQGLATHRDQDFGAVFIVAMVLRATSQHKR